MHVFDQNYFPDFIAENGGAMMTLESHVENYRAKFLRKGKRPPIVTIPQRSVVEHADISLLYWYSTYTLVLPQLYILLYSANGKEPL